MKVCILTPRLFIAARDLTGPLRIDQTSESEHVAEVIAQTARDRTGLDVVHAYLLTGYKSLRVSVCHRILRTLSTFAWLPSWLAFLPLRMCANEILEALRSYDPDVVSGLNLPWGRQLASFLSRRCPEWLVTSDTAGELRPVLRPEVDPRVKVSIVLPTYNGARYLRQSIESCLSQTFPNVELILVDDGSGPAVREAVEPFRSNERFKYVRHDRNWGIAASLNTGFRQSTGSYLTWTSDDNFYDPTAIEEMLQFLIRYPAVDFVYAASRAVDANGVVTGQQRPGPPAGLAQANCIGSCVLYKRSVYDAIGDYDSNAFLAEDYDYWMRIGRRFRMQRLARRLYSYRYHPDSLTARHSDTEIAAKAAWVRHKNEAAS